jgi:hypothetical protein
MFSLKVQDMQKRGLSVCGKYKSGPGDAACTNCEAAKFSADAGATACDIHEGLVP